MKSDYAGALREFRRPSDNATKAFYPDVNGVLSLTSEDGAGTTLADWITTEDGFRYQDFDQMGSGDNWVQATMALQPKDIVGGVLSLESNGLPAGDWNVSRLRNNSLRNKTLLDVYTVMNPTGTSYISVNGGHGNFYGWVATDGSASTNLHNIYGTPSMYVNGVLQSPSTRGDVFDSLDEGLCTVAEHGVATSTWYVFDEGGYTSGLDFAGSMMCRIYYEADTIADRDDILALIENSTQYNL